MDSNTSDAIEAAARYIGGAAIYGIAVWGVTQIESAGFGTLIIVSFLVIGGIFVGNTESNGFDMGP